MSYMNGSLVLCEFASLVLAQLTGAIGAVFLYRYIMSHVSRGWSSRDPVD